MNIYNMIDTWNAGGTTFTAIKMNVTDTASAAGSLLMDLQVAGVSQFKVRKDGLVTAAGPIYCSELQSTTYLLAGTDIYARSNTAKLLFGASDDLIITRDAANILAQRNGVNAQALRIANTWTSLTVNEQFAINWAANVCTITNEGNGGGVLRDLILKGILQTYDTTVAALPAAAAENKGQRRHVTDANATTFASTVAGGGANIVPVFSNGTNWIIG